MTKSKINVSETLNDLRKKRVDWEEGAYKSSNQRLYDILAECAELYEAARSNTALKKRLVSELVCVDAGSKKRVTYLERIVNDVFGRASNRERIYARAIKVWSDERDQNEAFPDFVVRRGGLENISRTCTTRVSQTLTPVQYRDVATAAFVEAPSLADFSVTRAMRSDDQNEGPYLVALVRMGEDGKGQVLDATNKLRLVNDALSILGKAVDGERRRHESESESRDLVTKRTEDLAAFLQKRAQGQEAA